MKCVRRSPGEFGLAAYRYFDEQGWQASARETSVWTTAGKSVDALDAPIRLAEPALKRLSARGLYGPVVRVPECPQRWVFVTQPARCTAAAVHTLLAMNDVRCLLSHDRIELPPTRTPHGELTWLRPPGPDTRPLPFDVVAVALLGVRAACGS